MLYLTSRLNSIYIFHLNLPICIATEAIEYLLKSKYSTAVSGKRTTSRPNEILISSRHHALQFWEKLVIHDYISFISFIIFLPCCL